MKNLLKKLAIYFTTIFTIIGLNCAILEIANASTVDDLLPRDYNLDLTPTKNDNEGTTPVIEASERYMKLTNKSLLEITASLIRTMLYLVSSLTVIALVVVGVLYLTGSLSEDNTTKAKKIFGYIGIAIIIISGSYGIITGILKINFFE